MDAPVRSRRPSQSSKPKRRRLQKANPVRRRRTWNPSKRGKAKKRTNFVPDLPLVASSLTKKASTAKHGDTLVISADAKKLLQHARNTEVRWSPNDACFIIKGSNGKSQRKAGLSVMLRRTFWPDYDYRRVTELIRTDAAARKNLHRQAHSRARTSNRERRSAAGLPWEDVPILTVTGRGHKRRFERGTAVHEELCYYAREGLERFLKKYPQPEIYTLRGILALREFGLVPIYGELPIYDETVGYATAVDMLCVDQKADQAKNLGCLVLCEIKTGYEMSTFDKGHKGMLGAARFLTNSRLNQARIQAYFAEMTLKQRYRITNCVSAVILIHDQGVTGYIITDDIIAQGAHMYRYAAAAETARLRKMKTTKNRPRRRRRTKKR